MMQRAARRQFGLMSSFAALAIIAGMARSGAQQCPQRLGEKVTNGTPAQAENWPGIASLRLFDPETKEAVHFCGGTVIAPSWVLTAGHCLNDLSLLRRSFFPGRVVRLQVVLGSDDLESAKADAVFDVDESGARIPDGYIEAVKEARRRRDEAAEVFAQGDIALIPLTTPYSGALAPLADGEVADTPEGQDELLVAGFGATDPSGRRLNKFTRPDTGEMLQVSSPRLLEAPLAVVAHADCGRAFPKAAISDRQLCAGTISTAKPTDSCNGDSGGPLMAITKTNRCLVQVGLVSFGPRTCAGDIVPMAVYTRISAYRGWISDAMRPPQDDVDSPQAQPRSGDHNHHRRTLRGSPIIGRMRPPQDDVDPPQTQPRSGDHNHHRRTLRGGPIIGRMRPPHTTDDPPQEQTSSGGRSIYAPPQDDVDPPQAHPSSGGHSHYRSRPRPSPRGHSHYRRPKPGGGAIIGRTRQRQKIDRTLGGDK